MISTAPADPRGTSLIPVTQTSNAVKHTRALLQPEPVKPLTHPQCQGARQHMPEQSHSLGPGFLPAHDLVGEEDAAHLWILVLAFVQDGLKSQTE